MNPKRRPLDFRTIDEVIAELDRLHKDGCQSCGKWNLAHMCNHLSVGVRGSMEGFKSPRPSWFLRMLAPLIIWWMFKKRQMPEGVNAPAEFQPHDVKDEATEVEETKQLLRRFQEHKGPLHPSPFAGNLSYDRWLNLHLIHCAHHLSFLHPGK
jgi:Protein of unknown function (DUF1569)